MTSRASSLRDRASSVFSIDDYVSKRIGKTNDESQKGKCTIVHWDKPNIYDRLLEETLDMFEQRRGSKEERLRNVSFLSEIKVPRRKSVGHPDEKKSDKYELEPRKPFDYGKVNRIILEEFKAVTLLPVVDQNIICTVLADDIKRKVKQLAFSRYRYIVTVTIGDNKNQGINIASRCLWDDKQDSFVSQSLKLKELFLVVNVYAIYVL